jgi:uncharacterized membrane protein
MSQPSDADVADGAGGTDDPPGSDAVSRRRRALLSWGPVLPVLIGATVAINGLGYLWKVPCERTNFADDPSFQKACYTDIYKLYFGRGLSQGKVPYLDKGQTPLEYPVLTGAYMQVMATLSRWVHGTTAGGAADVARGMAFYRYTVIGLAICAVITVVAVALLGGRQSTKVGLMVAASPVMLLSAFINWDLLAVMLAAVAFTAWNRKWHVAAGVLLGLAIAAKFYPVIFLGPLLILCLRTGKWREFGKMAGGAAVAWLVVNVPIMIMAWSSWVVFYSFSQQRLVDWGSIFYLFENEHVPILGSPGMLNELGTGLFLVACAAVGVLALAVKRRPRLPQLLFLVLAAFLLTNKVWSPQYALWLLPLVPLARPRLPAYLFWQAAEIVYFFGIWSFLTNLVTGGAQGITLDQYYIPLVARFVAVLVLVVLVVRDIVAPSNDVVRADGDDDPAGGVFDGAPDRIRLQLVAVPATGAVT